MTPRTRWALSTAGYLLLSLYWLRELLPGTASAVLLPTREDGWALALKTVIVLAWLAGAAVLALKLRQAWKEGGAMGRVPQRR